MGHRPKASMQITTIFAIGTSSNRLIAPLKPALEKIFHQTKIKKTAASRPTHPKISEEAPRAAPAPFSFIDSIPFKDVHIALFYPTYRRYAMITQVRGA